MAQEIQIPYVITRDSDGAWAARVRLWEGTEAFGRGASPDEAVADCSLTLRLVLKRLLTVIPDVPTTRC